MSSNVKPVCKVAREEVFLLRYVEEQEDGSRKAFYPLDRLRKYFRDTKVRDILDCTCDQCATDRSAFGNSAKISEYVQAIIGDETHTDQRQTALGLFGLLVYVEHPLLILGFIDEGLNDYFFENISDAFREEALRKHTGTFASKNTISFEQFADQFAMFMPQFTVRHMDSGKFSRYPVRTMLPFVKEREIGRQKDENGNWTSEGANGKVFEFEIYEEYRKFPHAKKVKRFARKRIDTTPFAAHLEKANLQNVQHYSDKHIVTLIKAYSIGGVINLIFPLARTNLDHLLRDSALDYASSRGGKLESHDAWRQLLGISKALAKIAGVPSDRDPSSPSRESNTPQWYGFHFDLKPANILIQEDGTWVITDFGQATFTYSSDRTPRVANQGGTDAYAPPEIDNLNEEFSRRYDVWSLGCIVLEVAAFVVLGYEGLKGCQSFLGLDQLRRQRDGWSNRQDERFFYLLQRHGEPFVKADIRNFMLSLKASVQDRDQTSQKFLADILQMVEMMLQPDVEKRSDIGDVIRILDTAIAQASSLDDDGKPLQTVAAAGETDIGGAELSVLELWHWNRSLKTWQKSSLQAFEDLDGNLRFYSLANNRVSTEIWLHRQEHEVLPHYAFWDRERPQASEAWVGFASIGPTGVAIIPGAVYAFSSLSDSRLFQSKLTYQHIEMSFPLSSVRVKRFTKTMRKVWDAVTNGFHTRDNECEELGEKLNEGKDLGKATIQLWTEKADEVDTIRREQECFAATKSDSKRKPRLQYHQQPGYRDIYPRRAVIYLHKYNCILTVKTEVNWIVRNVKNEPCALRFQPTDRDKDPHFVASLLVPTKGRPSAGLPLCPKVLRRNESQTRFEADYILLQFANDQDPTSFNACYRQLKKAWEKEKAEVEKLQGFTPVHRVLDPHPELLESQPKTKVRPGHHSVQESYARGTDRGKSTVRAQDTSQTYGSYANEAARSPGLSRPNGISALQRSETHVLIPKPILSHGGGGRGRPPKAFKKKPSSETETSSKDSSHNDSFNLV